MNVDHEEQEESQEYNGMVLVVAPNGVELKGSFIEHHQDEDDSYQDDKESSCEYSREIPKGIDVVTTTTVDDISCINDDFERFEMAATEEEVASTKVDPRFSILKLFRGLREHQRGKREAFKVVVRHGKERFEV